MNTSSQANIAIANKLREQGYRSLIDAQPHIRKRVFKLYRMGLTATAIERVLLEEKQESDYIPSRTQIQAYCRRNFTPPRIVFNVEPYTPVVNQMLLELIPPLEKTSGQMKELWQMIENIDTRSDDATEEDFTRKMEMMTQYAKFRTKFANEMYSSGVARKVLADNLSVVHAMFNPEFETQVSSEHRRRDPKKIRGKWY